jgi:uncharacterized membrane protein YtjA (UPF0391 family)
VLALVAGYLGFFGLAGMSAALAKLAFIAVVVLLVVGAFATPLRGPASVMNKHPEYFWCPRNDLTGRGVV